MTGRGRARGGLCAASPSSPHLRGETRTAGFLRRRGDAQRPVPCVRMGWETSQVEKARGERRWGRGPRPSWRTPPWPRGDTPPPAAPPHHPATHAAADRRPTPAQSPAPRRCAAHGVPAAGAAGEALTAAARRGDGRAPQSCPSHQSERVGGGRSAGTAPPSGSSQSPRRWHAHPCPGRPLPRRPPPAASPRHLVA